MQKIDLIINALMVSNSTLWSAKIDQALFVARELKLELNKRKLVGLTDNEIIQCYEMNFMEFARNIEATIKEKNERTT
jgi:hypothetical protein